MPSSLKTTQEDRLWCKNILQIFLQAFPTLDLVSLIFPNLRTPLSGFWHPLWQLFYNTYSRCCNKKFPFPKCILTLYATQFYSLDPCFLHHPSASSPHIYSYFKLHYYSAKSLAQRNSSTTNLVVWTRKKNIRKNMLPCSSILLLILPSTINYTNLFSMQSLPPPSIARRNSCSP